MDEIVSWASDPYWLEALEEIQKLRNKGLRQLVLDLDAIEAVISTGSGPAYKLMYAMQSVLELEGWEGFKGAPRVVWALLYRLSQLKIVDGTLVGD